METERFDTLVQSLTLTRSRRGALAALLSGSLGLLGLSEAATKKKKKGKGKKGKGKKGKGKCGKALGDSVGGEAIECPKRIPCEDSYDCDQDMICRSGQCVPGCEDSADCSYNKICQSGQCVIGCEQDSYCPANSYCQNSQCVAGCVGHINCQFDYRCLNGTCVPKECFTDEDCPSGQSCLGDFTCF